MTVQRNFTARGQGPTCNAQAYVACGSAHPGEITLTFSAHGQDYIPAPGENKRLKARMSVAEARVLALSLSRMIEEIERTTA